MKPYIHAELSVRKHGGTIDDYLDIHNFLDSSKAHIPDMRHRVLLHNSFGIYLVEQQFGVYRANSDGKNYSVRDICEEHIVQDLGFIPTVQQCLEEVTLQGWLGGFGKNTRISRIPLVD